MRLWSDLARLALLRNGLPDDARYGDSYTTKEAQSLGGSFFPSRACLETAGVLELLYLGQNYEFMFGTCSSSARHHPTAK